MQSNQCILCLRNLRIGPPGGICRAFPLGIPQEILDGRFDHSKPHPEQFNKDILRLDEDPGVPFERFPMVEDFDGMPIKATDERPNFPPYPNLPTD